MSEERARILMEFLVKALLKQEGLTAEKIIITKRKSVAEETA